MLEQIKNIVADRIATKSVTSGRTEERLTSEEFVAKFSELVSNYRLMEEVDNGKTSYTFFGNKNE